MVVSELIEWLKTQDQGATVDVVRGLRGREWEGDSYCQVEFSPGELSEYIDMRGNQFAVGTPSENSRTLLLGYAE